LEFVTQMPKFVFGRIISKLCVSTDLAVKDTDAVILCGPYRSRMLKNRYTNHVVSIELINWFDATIGQ
jgi:hypothetical protein